MRFYRVWRMVIYWEFPKNCVTAYNPLTGE